MLQEMTSCCPQTGFRKKRACVRNVEHGAADVPQEHLHHPNGREGPRRTGAPGARVRTNNRRIRLDPAPGRRRPARDPRRSSVPRGRACPKVEPTGKVAGHRVANAHGTNHARALQPRGEGAELIGPHGFPGGRVHAACARPPRQSKRSRGHIVYYNKAPMFRVHVPPCSTVGTNGAFFWRTPCHRAATRSGWRTPGSPRATGGAANPCCSATTPSFDARRTTVVRTSSAPVSAFPVERPEAIRRSAPCDRHGEQ